MNILVYYNCVEKYVLNFALLPVKILQAKVFVVNRKIIECGTDWMTFLLCMLLKVCLKDIIYSICEGFCRFLLG